MILLRPSDNLLFCYSFRIIIRVVTFSHHEWPWTENVLKFASMTQMRMVCMNGLHGVYSSCLFLLLLSTAWLGFNGVFARAVRSAARQVARQAWSPCQRYKISTPVRFTFCWCILCYRRQAKITGHDNVTPHSEVLIKSSKIQDNIDFFSNLKTSWFWLYLHTPIRLWPCLKVFCDKMYMYTQIMKFFLQSNYCPGLFKLFTRMRVESLVARVSVKAP